jgi:hypothetical protein
MAVFSNRAMSAVLIGHTTVGPHFSGETLTMAQNICQSYKSFIQSIVQSIPIDKAKLALAQQLLNELIDQGVTGPPLDRFKAVVAQRQQIVDDDHAQLEAFKEEYQFANCGNPELIPGVPGVDPN